MAAFKEPGFQERVAAAARARSEALTKLRDKPRPDEAVLAARAATRQARDAAAAEKRLAARQAREEAAAERKRASALAAAAEAEAKAASAAAAAPPPALSESERKAARDARYAARKSRTK
jgi:hypothetical protein